MEIVIISKDSIKPSSPTPLHQHKISLIDQFMPSVYFPMILYYPNHYQHNNILPSDRSQVLKQSLSQTLPQFYPLAGRVSDDLSINFNDEGVLYLEAKASITLAEYLKQPNLTSLHEFLPIKSPFYESGPGSYVTMIQETTFACGGTTLGINVLHLVMDGCALASFLKAWASMACDSTKIYPALDGPSVFPIYDDFPYDAKLVALWEPFIRVGMMDTRRFVFDGSAIDSLKEEVKRSGVKNPTRFEVVSALLSRRLMAVFKSKSSDIHKPLAITLAVNIRRRMVPPLPECSVGNFVSVADAIFTQKEPQLGSLVCQIKDSIAKVDTSFVKNIQGEGGVVKFYERIKAIKDSFTSPKFCNGVDYVAFSSWCGFDLYEVDFGWGKPVWTTYAGSYGKFKAPFVNYIVLMDARKNKGIEAWVVLDEETLAMLEKDEELLQYAYHNPSPTKD